MRSRPVRDRGLRAEAFSFRRFRRIRGCRAHWPTMLAAPETSRSRARRPAVLGLSRPCEPAVPEAKFRKPNRLGRRPPLQPLRQAGIGIAARSASGRHEAAAARPAQAAVQAGNASQPAKKPVSSCAAWEQVVAPSGTADPISRTATARRLRQCARRKADRPQRPCALFIPCQARRAACRSHRRICLPDAGHCRPLPEAWLDTAKSGEIPDLSAEHRIPAAGASAVRRKSERPRVRCLKAGVPRAQGRWARHGIPAPEKTCR